MKPDVAEHVRRRGELMRMVGPDGIVILPAASQVIRSRDLHYPFRQNSDFLYLTGFTEPQAVLVLVPGRDAGEQILFCRESEPEAERWHGRRAGLERAKADYQFDDTYPITDLDDIVPNLMEGRDRVFYRLGRNNPFDQQVMDWVERVRRGVSRGGRGPGEFVSLDHYLHELRLFKSREELKIMRHAARLAASAHCRAMRICEPGMHEYQLVAEMQHELAKEDAGFAYEPIVGAGRNGLILHYVENSAPIADGDLVLIDAGAEVNGYASDISRTFPANGAFTAEQRAVYDIVLAAQAAAIDSIKPGADWEAPHDAAVEVLSQGLIDLGLLGDSIEQAIEEKTYRRYYPHKTGHWLGLDVHDVGDYRVDGHSRQLEPGMVFTVEPGLYLDPAEGEMEARWQNIAIRIEDDVLVTRQGCEVLSNDVPKDAAQIEELMARG